MTDLYLVARLDWEDSGEPNVRSWRWGKNHRECLGNGLHKTAEALPSVVGGWRWRDWVRGRTGRDDPEKAF